MKKHAFIALTLVAVLGIFGHANAQEEIQTVFKAAPHKVTAYGALHNKFTRIDGEFVNLSGIYGGVYINRRLMIGVAGAAATNNIPVPEKYRAIEGRNMSYEYGQFGLITEYVIGSNKAIHPVINFFAGPGFTVQYDRYDYTDWDFEDDGHHDENWFMVAEPGIQLEINVTKWMRFSPGVSYRFAYGSDAEGLTDSKLSGGSVNATLKFGRF